MKLNEDTVISHSDTPVVLVPYVEKHVGRYHNWMQSPELLELTASDPLTLSEEESNMRSWRKDDKKMTFILVDTSISANYIIGDVNLYLLPNDGESDDDDDDDDDNNNNNSKGSGSKSKKCSAEVEVMIAEQQARRKGIATHAVLLMMAFAHEHLPAIDEFVAKILNSNTASVALFEKKLGFEEFRRVKAFGEVHLRRRVDSSLTHALSAVRAKWAIQSYRSSEFHRQAIDNPVTDD